MLELTKLIDQYLQGELSGAELKEFESRLKTDPELKTELHLQTQLMQGIQRAGLNNQLLKAKKGYLAKKLLLKIALILVVAAGAAIFLTKLNTKSPELPKQELKQEADTFTINQISDTLIETANGMVFYIPAFAFDTKSDSVNIVIEEALDAASIMMKGLETFSDSALLETAGMFKFNASAKGAEVAILKEITASLPTAKVDKEMMLFKGEEDSAGKVNWVNPQKIATPQLRTVDINSLTFFPKGYLELTDKFYGLKRVNKESKRIYYEMSGWCDVKSRFSNEKEIDKISSDTSPNLAPTNSLKTLGGAEYMAIERSRRRGLGGILIPKDKPAGTIFRDTVYNSKGKMKEWHTQRVHKVYYEDYIDKSGRLFRGKRRDITCIVENVDGSPGSILSTFDYDTFFQLNTKSDLASSKKCERKTNCEIDPSSIKAIWNAKFNNTFIAAKEFEERLQLIFSTCKSKYLNTYLKNLDKPIWYSDSLCMLSHSGFKRFYMRKDGGVNLEDQVSASLNAYYKKKQKVYKDAAAKTWAKYHEEVERKATEFQTKNAERAVVNSIRKTNNFRREYEENLDNAYKQLGLEKKKQVAYHKAYVFPITTNGWYNVDKYVADATMARTTLDYTDPITGKKAVIAYKKVKLNIVNLKQYDVLRAYLVPKQLNSFMQMKKMETGFTESLNSSFDNTVIVLAQKGDQWYWLPIANVIGKTYHVKLKRIKKEDLAEKLNFFDNQKKEEVLKDIAFASYEFSYQKEETQRKVFEEQKDKIAKVIWPCYVERTLDNPITQEPIGGDL